LPDPSWNKTVKAGDIGIVIDMSEIKIAHQMQVWVEFENGSRLALLEGVDIFEVISKKEGE